MRKLVMLCLCSLLLVGCGNGKVSNEDMGKIKEDELSGKFFEDQMIDTLEIQNFNIASSDGESFISFTVKNISSDVANVEYIKIYLFSNDGILLHETYGYVGGSLAGGESKFISIDVDTDLTDATKVSFERM